MWHLQLTKCRGELTLSSITLALIGNLFAGYPRSSSGVKSCAGRCFWGIMAGGRQALYTLLPRTLLAKYDARAVTGWSMLLGELRHFTAIRAASQSATNFT